MPDGLDSLPPLNFSRRYLLAITAVLAVAVEGRFRRVTKHDIAARLGLEDARVLETLLGALTRQKLLIAGRGPRGGYHLAREPKSISAWTCSRRSEETACMAIATGGTWAV